MQLTESISPSTIYTITPTQETLENSQASSTPIENPPQSFIYSPTSYALVLTSGNVGPTSIQILTTSYQLQPITQTKQAQSSTPEYVADTPEHSTSHTVNQFQSTESPFVVSMIDTSSVSANDISKKTVIEGAGKSTLTENQLGSATYKTTDVVLIQSETSENNHLQSSNSVQMLYTPTTLHSSDRSLTQPLEVNSLQSTYTSKNLQYFTTALTKIYSTDSTVLMGSNFQSTGLDSRVRPTKTESADPKQTGSTYLTESTQHQRQSTISVTGFQSTGTSTRAQLTITASRAYKGSSEVELQPITSGSDDNTFRDTSKTGDSRSGFSTRYVTGMQHSQKAFSTQLPYTVLETSATLSSTDGSLHTSTTGTHNWLPYSLIVESKDTSTQSSTTVDLGATSTLPQAITPPTAVPQPAGHSLITIGFKEALNYPFLISHPLSSAQIFSFLPRVLQYPFSSTAGSVPIYRRQDIEVMTLLQRRLTSSAAEIDTCSLSFQDYDKIQLVSVKLASLKSENRTDQENNSLHRRSVNDKVSVMNSTSDSSNIDYSQIVVKQIIPLVSSSINYIVSVAEVYFPDHSIDTLQRLIRNQNSELYKNPENSLKALASLIDPSVPLTGLVDSDGNSVTNEEGGNSGSSGSNSSGDSDPSSGGSGESQGGANGDGSASGSLDDGAYGEMSFAITKRLIIYLLVFSFVTILWIVAWLYFLKRLYGIEAIGKRLKPSDKTWSSSPGAFYNHHYNSHYSDPNNPFYDPERSLQEKCSFDDRYDYDYDTEEQDGYLHDDLVVTGDNTVYSTSRGLSYFIDENGNYYYAGMDSIVNENEQANEFVDHNPSQSMEHIYEGHDSIAGGALIDEEGAFDINAVDVDEEGNIELPDSDFNVPTTVTDVEGGKTDTVESYNNNQYYKMNTLITTESSEQQVGNSLSVSGAGFALVSSSNEGSNGIIPLKSHDENYEDYFYDSSHEDEGLSNVENTDTTKYNRAHALSLSINSNGDGDDYEEEEEEEEDDDGDVEDYAIDLDDEDDVNDVIVGELDELDEEMYRRLSSFNELHGLQNRSSGTNTYESTVNQQIFAQLPTASTATSSYSTPHFKSQKTLSTPRPDNQDSAGDWSTSNSTASFMSPSVVVVGASAGEASLALSTPSKPKRPDRPSSTLNFDELMDNIPPDVAMAAAESTSRYLRTTPRSDVKKYNSSIYWDFEKHPHNEVGDKPRNNQSLDNFSNKLTSSSISSANNVAVASVFNPEVHVTTAKTPSVTSDSKDHRLAEFQVDAISRKSTKKGHKSRSSWTKSITESVRHSVVLSTSHSRRGSLSKAIPATGPRGHTREELKKIRISGPIFSENSLGWSAMK